MVSPRWDVCELGGGAIPSDLQILNRTCHTYIGYVFNGIRSLLDVWSADVATNGENHRPS